MGLRVLLLLIIIFEVSVYIRILLEANMSRPANDIFTLRERSLSAADTKKLSDLRAREAQIDKMDNSKISDTQADKLMDELVEISAQISIMLDPKEYHARKAIIDERRRLEGEMSKASKDERNGVEKASEKYEDLHRQYMDANDRLAAHSVEYFRTLLVEHALKPLTTLVERGRSDGKKLSADDKAQLQTLRSLIEENAKHGLINYEVKKDNEGKPYIIVGEMALPPKQTAAIAACQDVIGKTQSLLKEASEFTEKARIRP